MAESEHKTKPAKKPEILKNISAEEALAVLRALAEESKEFKQKVEEAAKKHLAKVDGEEVAADVFMELDGIEVEELWDRSGETAYGYEDPNDVGWKMFEEVVNPYIEQLKKYQKLGMCEQAKQQCFGIIKGIKEYKQKSKSDFKDWAEDVPLDALTEVLDIWKEWCEDPKELERMKNLARSH